MVFNRIRRTHASVQLFRKLVLLPYQLDKQSKLCNIILSQMPVTVGI